MGEAIRNSPMNRGHINRAKIEEIEAIALEVHNKVGGLIKRLRQ